MSSTRRRSPCSWRVAVPLTPLPLPSRGKAHSQQHRPEPSSPPQAPRPEGPPHSSPLRTTLSTRLISSSTAVTAAHPLRGRGGGRGSRDHQVGCCLSCCSCSFKKWVVRTCAANAECDYTSSKTRTKKLHASNIPEVIEHQYEWESPQKKLCPHGAHFGDHSGSTGRGVPIPRHCWRVPHVATLFDSLSLGLVPWESQIYFHVHFNHVFVTLKTTCQQFCIFAEGLW